MDKAKRQTMRLSDNELELLKSTFADADDLLMTVRNLFLGLEITDEEKKQVSAVFASEALRKLMRKQLFPELQPDIPIGQNIDLWMTVDLKDKEPEQIRFIVITRVKLIETIEVALSLLENPNGARIDLMEWKDTSEDANFAGTTLLARNTFISHIESQMSVIKVLSGLKSENVEETKKRLLQDSSK